ncbi:MAG: PAS domain-containing protein [Propionibacteriaceae bacterium]|nr:PAS domain-containing protein [Propionibacteriaceae bacterium]
MVLVVSEQDQDWPSLPCDRVPTGATHEVGVDELFFSTTDLLGVITAANPVFVRLSRFGYKELMDAPHNIIRHPVMPGGAFKLMWDTLKAGKPFCAYVDNLAADGSTYCVFATITPLGQDSYLSVRSRPMATALKAAADSLYRATRPLELMARSNGESARRAAELGLEHLANLLVAAGFPSYDEFMWNALATEVGIRHTAAMRLERPAAAGPFAELLAGAHRLGEELHHWSGHEEQLSQVVKALDNGLPRLRAATDGALGAARAFEDAAKDRFAPLLLSLTVWAEMMGEINRLIEELEADLHRLRSSSTETIFRLALATLHTDTVAQFAVELIDGVTVPDYDDQASRQALRLLGQALSEGFEATRLQEIANAQLARDTAAKLDEIRDLITIPRSLIQQWQTMVAGSDDAAIASLLPRVAAEVQRTDESLRLLADLAQECSTIAQEPPPDAVNAELERLLASIRSVDET